LHKGPLFYKQRTPSLETQYVPFLPEDFNYCDVKQSTPSYDKHINSFEVEFVEFVEFVL
jgi:hypothetical protein